MHLKDNDLKQLNREYLASLPSEQLLGLAERLLNDLRDARDRQNQTPQNISRPPGSYSPWEQAQFSDTQEQTDETDSHERTEDEKSEKRKPGK